MKNQNKQNSSVRRPAYTTWAFTLVELIVVITILAILWTIAFISLQWYSAQARDSKRLSDISNIKKSVELFSLNTWKYPEPDDSVIMSYSWEALRYQWTVWDQVSINVSRNLNEKPTDPSTGNEYTYSTTYSQTEYEVLGLYESDLLWKNVGAPLVGVLQSNATTLDYPKIDWNYNWIYIKTPSFYVPTPSIINAEIVSNDDLDDDMIKSQIITGWDNLPWVSTWWLDVTFSYYEWTMTSESTEEEKIALVEAIQTTYSWSSLANDTMYYDLLSRTGTWEMEDFVDVVVLGRTEYNSSSSTTSTDTIAWPIWNDEYTKLLLHWGWSWDELSNFNNITHNWIINYITENWTPLDNKSIQFNWSTNYYSSISTLLSSPFIDTNEDFTVEFFVKTSDSIGTFFTNRWESSNYTMWLGHWLGGLWFYYGWGGAIWTTLINDDTRHHVALTRKNNVHNLWVDWESKWGYTSWITYINNIITFGSDPIDYSSRALDGNMTEIRISDIARYDTTFSVTTEQFSYDNNTLFLYHWSWDESSSNHSLALNWNIQISNEWKFGNCYSFDWNWDYLSLADNDDWDFWSWDFTVDFWVKFLTTTWSIPLFNQRISSSDNIELHYWWPSANDFVFLLNDSDILKWNWIPNSNQWYHIAVVRNSDNWNLYVDGNSIDSTINSLTLPNKSVNFNIGNLNTHYFNWYIDEFRVSKWIARTLDPDDYMYDPEWDWFDVPTQEYWN